ncbi:MAG: DNA-directed RNA polymerase specialized sigma24 family protein [Verrucomicrobiales bacterium]|jgi:DNA-directed RNA polymerase specialized sigma24 family protein
MAKNPQDPSLPGGLFPETQWSLIHRVRQEGPDGAAALEALCRGYWPTIYGFLRARGCSKEDAEDLTQGFFELILRKGLFQSGQAERGRLSSLLLTALKQFHISQIRGARAQKRGGKQVMVPFDVEIAEKYFESHSNANRDPEKIYLAAWARGLIDQAREKLRVAYQRSPRPDVSTALEPYLDPEYDRVPYREFAVKFTMREAALRLQLFRLRQKFGDLIREEIRQTVDTPKEAADELHWLMATLKEG